MAALRRHTKWFGRGSKFFTGAALHLAIGEERDTVMTAPDEAVMHRDPEHIVIVSGIGAVRLRVNRRARRIVLRISDEGEPVATVPHPSFFDEAIDFILSRRDWVIREQAHGTPLPPPLPYEPPALTFDEAAAILVPRIRELAAGHGLAMTTVSVRRQRTVWGSCNAKGGLTINWKTARLPDHLRDYVILHELAHLRYRSHGPRYWRTLDRFVDGDARTLDRELKKWSLALL